MGEITKMRIDAFSDGTFKSKAGSYDAMINPDTIKLDRSIEYTTEQAPDKSKASSKYKKTPGSTLSFELTLDCTGVVDAKRTDLPKDLKQLQAIVYDYNGSIHRPNFVQIRWGLIETFQGVLTTFNTSYTLFDPDGVPLRAKISLAFTSYLDPTTAAKMEGNQSPDLTHIVNVVRGDSLSGLSQRIYDTPDYYVQLAEFNKLDKFRQLQPGMQLIVPPLVTQGKSQ
ncbi:MAG: LysM peptidoglycan-binding domain-containing protein [Methylococcales bacterium]|nr:LysM peptidoglycan-binding domain-containing protein [Methylococcales bacterium]